MGGFHAYLKYFNHSHSTINQLTQEVDDKQVPKNDFDK